MINLLPPAFLHLRGLHCPSLPLHCPPLPSTDLRHFPCFPCLPARIPLVGASQFGVCAEAASRITPFHVIGKKTTVLTDQLGSLLSFVISSYKTTKASASQPVITTVIHTHHQSPLPPWNRLRALPLTVAERSRTRFARGRGTTILLSRCVAAHTQVAEW